MTPSNDATVDITSTCRAFVGYFSSIYPER